MKVFRKVINFISISLFAFLVIVVFLQVVSRTIGIAIPWTEEAARFTFIWLVFLGGTITVAKGMNMTFDLIIDSLPDRLWKPAFIVLTLISVAFLAIIIVSGFQLAIMNMGQLSSVLRIPMGYVYIAIPIGCLGMLIMQIDTFFKLYRKRDEVLC